MFTWQEGRSLRGRLDDADLVAAMGELLALLHAHAADFANVSADEVLHGDRGCYLRVPDALSDDGSLLAEGVAWAQEGLDALWTTRGGAAHLCHGDLHPNNVLVRHRRVVPVDFQDAMWGLEEQDIAITLVMLAREDPSGGAAAALRRGYERHRAWPAVAPATMDLLMIVRRLHIVNVLTAVRPAMVPPFRAAVLHDLRRVLGDQR
jgi:Ser/Thr protein kinase RdoA (MazF antagonist)